MQKVAGSIPAYSMRLRNKDLVLITGDGPRICDIIWTDCMTFKIVGKGDR